MLELVVQVNEMVKRVRLLIVHLCILGQLR